MNLWAAAGRGIVRSEQGSAEESKDNSFFSEQAEKIGVYYYVGGKY